jgi:hypothetical protein
VAIPAKTGLGIQSDEGNAMTIQLTEEQAQVIDRAVQAGLIRDAGEAVEAGVEAIRRRLEAEPASASSMPYEQWSREFKAWVDSHPRGGPLLSDEAVERESIYGDRDL